MSEMDKGKQMSNNDFDEPWVVSRTAKLDTMPVTARDGTVAIVHAAFDDDDAPIVAVLRDQPATVWRRVVACVNACQVISTEDLEDESNSVIIVS